MYVVCHFLFTLLFFLSKKIMACMIYLYEYILLFLLFLVEAKSSR